MAQGYSAISRLRDTSESCRIHNRQLGERNIHEFLEALNRAKAKRLLEWEKIGLKVAREGRQLAAQSTHRVTFGLEKHGRRRVGSISNSSSTPARTAGQSKPSSYLRWKQQGGSPSPGQKGMRALEGK